MSFWGVTFAICIQLVTAGIFGMVVAAWIAFKAETYDKNDYQHMFFLVNFICFILALFASVGLLIYGLIFSDSSHYYQYLGLPWFFALTGFSYHIYCHLRYSKAYRMKEMQMWREHWYETLEIETDEDLSKFKLDDVIRFGAWKASSEKQASCLDILPAGEEVYQRVQQAKALAATKVPADDQMVLNKLKEFEASVSTVYRLSYKASHAFGFKNDESHSFQRNVRRGNKDTYPDLEDEVSKVLDALNEIAIVTISNNSGETMIDAHIFLQYGLEGLFGEQEILTNYVLWTYVEHFYHVNPFQLALELSQMGVKVLKKDGEIFVFVEEPEQSSLQLEDFNSGTQYAMSTS